MTAPEAFKHLVAKLAGVLRTHGYSRSGNAFLYSRGGNCSLVQIQKSLKTTRDEVVFTLNLGVVSGRLGRFFNGVSPDVLARRGMCHWSERLGFLLPDPYDRWWSIRPEHPIDSLTAEMSGLLVAVALPQIERNLHDESLRDLWLTGSSPGLTDAQRLENLAVLLSVLGPRELVAPTLDAVRRVSAGKAAWIQTKLSSGAFA